MGFKDWLESIFISDQEMDDDFNETDDQKSSNLVHLHTVSSSSTPIHVFNIDNDAEVRKVAEWVKSGDLVVLTHEGLSETDFDQVRIYLEGLVFGLNGGITDVGSGTLLLTPSGYQVKHEED